MISFIHALVVQIQKKISDKEAKAVIGLEQKRQALENQLSEMTNLTCLVDTTLASARHTSLLNQIQGGFLERIRKNTLKPKVLHSQITKPNFQEARNIPFDNILGTVTFDVVIYLTNTVGELIPETNFFV